MINHFFEITQELKNGINANRHLITIQKVGAEFSKTDHEKTKNEEYRSELLQSIEPAG